MEYKDYYEILGTKRDASDSEIKSAYRKLTKKYHPDVCKEKNAESKFKDINEAYEVLGDKEKRKRYDQLGSSWQGGADFTPPPDFGGFDFSQFRQGGFSGSGQARSGAGGFSDFFSAIFGDLMNEGASSHGSSRGFSGGTRGFSSGNSSFNDIYTNASRGGRGGSKRPVDSEKKENLDINQNIVLNVKDLMNSGTKNIILTDFKKCSYCSSDHKTFCTHCSGSGIEKICKNISVKIPKFIQPGKKIRLKGEGRQDEYGNKGDLYLTVKISDSLYTVDGADVTSEVDITPSGAVLGSKKDVETPHGKVSISIPKETSSGKLLRLKGLGLPKKEGGFGNFNAKIKIVLPKTISEKEIELYKKLAETEEESK